MPQEVKEKQTNDVPAKSIKTEYVQNVTRKWRHNKNGKVGINKNNNYAYVPNAFREVCQNCSSPNHLTHVCKKPVGSVP